MANTLSTRRLIFGISLVAFALFLAGYRLLSTAEATHARSLASAATGTGRVEYSKFHSASLDRDVPFAVSLPPSYDKETSKRFPVVIFLHGLFNSEKDWESRGVQAKLDEARAAGKIGEYIVAAPYGANSFYLNGKDGTRYEDAIVKDFVPFVDQSYRTTGNRKGRMIEGISMGGYGALVIAFKHPELFAGVAAHCAAIFDELPKPSTDSDRRAQFRYQIASKIFGNPPDMAFFQENSPLYVAKTNASKLKDLPIYFDVGSEDRYGFDAGNKQLDAALTESKVKHEFHLVPGDHGWPFFLSRSEQAFTFCWKTLQ
jgi:S-formylglutathione hydrolase